MNSHDVDGGTVVPLAIGIPEVVEPTFEVGAEITVAKGDGPYGVLVLFFSESNNNLSKGDLGFVTEFESKNNFFSSRFWCCRRICAFED